MVFSSNRRHYNIRYMCTKIKVLLSFKKLVDLSINMLFRYPMASLNDMREHSTVLQKVCFKWNKIIDLHFLCFIRQTEYWKLVQSHSKLFSHRHLFSEKYAKGREITVYRVILLSCNYLPSTLANRFAQSWIFPDTVVLKER